MFGPFWIARRTVRAFTPRRRYRSCNTPSPSAGDTLKIFLWVISPLLAIFGFFAAIAALNALCVWLDTTWHRGPWYATAIIAGAVVAAGALAALRRQRRTTLREQLITEHLSPRVNRYYTCCGLPAGQMHATTCPTWRTPPDNPAKWSDRR